MACVSAFGTRESKRADFCKPSSSYARSTAAENIPDSSTKPASSGAWNLIFTLQRRGPPRRRAWKLLLLYHTHGSASKSLYMPCEIMVQLESSELKHILRRIQNILQEKLGRRGCFSCRLDCIHVFWWASRQRWEAWRPTCATPRRLRPNSKGNTLLLSPGSLK